jgi:alkaline phosphatase D
MRYAVTMNLRRRDLFRLAGAGAAQLALGCGDNQRYRDPGPDHASAVLEPEQDSFVVALWSPLSRAATVEVHAAGQLVRSQIVGFADEHATALIDGLAPSTSYQLSIMTDDGARLVHVAQTAPSPDDPRPVRLAVSADLDPSPEFASDLQAHLAALAPELYISIGDFPYTDNGPPAMTVPDYRARHAELRTSPPTRAWMQAMGVRAIYDDHEFRNNWDAMFVAAEPERYAAAMQVWDEFFPLRAPTGDIRYRSWRWGAHVECFLLDTRRYRSADAAPDDASKTMLGAIQHGWLVDAVARSTATFKLIFTTVPLDFGTGNDFWASFSTERDALLAQLIGVPGILFVSGDQHFFASYQHAYGIREFQIGPVARGLGTPAPPVTGVLFRSVQYNFGLIEVDGDALTFSGIGADGNAFHIERLTAAQLTPQPS